MRKNNPAVTEADQASPEREILELHKKTKSLEASLKGYEKSLTFWNTFIIVITAVVLIPSIIIIIFNSVESYSLKIVTAVITGIVGLLAGVGYCEFVEERRRMSRINELRISEKEFLDRIKRDLLSRLT